MRILKYTKKKAQKILRERKGNHMEELWKYIVLAALIFVIYKGGKVVKKIIGIVLAAFIAYMVAGYLGLF